jgi:hypothetical protein
MTNERKTNGVDAGDAREDTPIISVGGPDGAANRIAQLRVTLERTCGLCDQVERLVRARGFDPQARAALSELADYFDGNLAMIAAGTGRVLRRLANLRT